MNVIAFPSVTPLASETSDIMGTAFEAAWRAFCASGERVSAQVACDTRIRLARVILDLVQQGERDLVRLQDFALASLDEEPVGRSEPARL
jgi:hypothetical protein